MKKARIALCVLTLLTGAFALRAQDKVKSEAKVPPATLKVQVTITETEGERKLVNLPYTFYMRAGEGGPASPWTKVRMGSRVPVYVGKDGGMQYISMERITGGTLKERLRAGALGPRRWIPGGGAHPRAVVGHLLAGLELASQLASPPDAIVLPLGTGGTAAGLALAVTALGWPTRVVGVRVAPRIVANRWRAMWLARGAARLLARHDIRIPHPASRLRLVVVDGLGEGYGHPTPEGEAAERLASEHGLTLDPTYGAKAFAFLLQRGPCNLQRVVFWHTFAVPVPQPERAP